MKNLKLIITSIVFLFAVQVFANNPNPKKPSDKLRSEITSRLESIVFFDLNKNEVTANVFFTINTKGELVVVAIESDNLEVKDQIKHRINYKKVSYRPNKVGEIYLMPVRVVGS